MKNNLIVESLNKIISCAADDTKFIVYGAGEYGKTIMRWLCELEAVTDAYFLDRDDRKWGSLVDGFFVYRPEVLWQENKENIRIIVTVEKFRDAVVYLESFGLERGKQIFDLDGLGRRKPCDLIDPLLGYSRMDDIEGFKIFGEAANDKIVILGNSTSDYSNYNLKSWGELLFEKYQKKEKDISVYIGAITGYCSAQEMFKLIRDVLVLKPKVVISMSGINDPAEKKTLKKYPIMLSYTEHMYSKYILNLEKGKSLGLGLQNDNELSEVWLQNMRIMRAICEEFGIIFIALLQPSLHGGSYSCSKHEKDILYKTYTPEQNKKYKDFMKDTGKLIKEQKDIFDLTNIFDDEEGIFYDHCHCNERGNEIIAKRVYEILTSKEII